MAKKKSEKVGKRAGYKLLLILLILLLFAMDYPFLDKILKDKFSNYEVGIVERVIDGDTLVINGSSVRLLGINSPEKGEKYYEEAQAFLENKTLNKFVKLKKGKTDLDIYQRKLRYVYVEDKNINVELVKEGLANYYFPEGKERYYNDFKKAWGECDKNGKKLCEKSKESCAKCITLKSLDVKNQKVVLENNCQFFCNLDKWTIKDEGRKKFMFQSFILEKQIEVIVDNKTSTRTTLYWSNETYVWTKTGDTLFLRDTTGKLVLWWGY